MKKIYLALSLLCIAIASFAQVSVTATGGLPPGTYNYTTLKAAFDAINVGNHKSTVNISITGNTTETATATLNASGTGAASYGIVTISAAGGAARTIEGNIDGPLIDLNGADNVLIDGRNSGGNSLTISNTSTTSTNSNSTIRFINDASNNRVLNTTILGASTSVTLGTIFVSNGTTTGNNNNRIQFCNIGDANGSFPVNAIYAAGSTTAGQENSADSITNNNIYNFFHPDLSTAGILIGTGNTGWGIENNRFYQTATRTFTTGNPHRVIQVQAGSNYLIQGNVIGFASSAGTGTYTLAGAVTSRLLVIDLAVGTASPTSVQGNTISNLSFTTSNTSSSATGIWCGINVSAGDANIGTITGNTIGAATGNGNISILPTVAGTFSVSITSSSTGTVTIAKNIIGAIDVVPAGVLSGNMSGIQAQGTGGTISITNNIIGTTTANNLRIGTAGVTTGNGTLRGILNSNTGTVNITGNIIRNLTHYSNNALATFRAIEMQAGAGNIANNTISDITAYGASVSVLTAEGAGMLVTSSTPGIVIDNNTITNLNLANNTTTNGMALMGIYLGSNVNGTRITRNKMYGFTNASTSVSTTVPGVVAGIYMRDANAANPIVVANNMLSFGTGESTNTSFIGIWNQVNSTTNYTARILYNTVNIQGSAASGSQPSFCYYRGDFSSTVFNGPVVDIKNNIFTNTRSGGSGKHYAIANNYGAANSGATGWAPNASDYNILNANASTVGYWSGDQSLASWQPASSGDFHSYSGVAVVYVNNVSDLHLVTTTGANAAADGKGIPIAAITTDIDNDVRDAATPDLGADEFIQVPLSITMEFFKGKKVLSANLLEWKSGCSSASVTFQIERSEDARKFASIGRFTATQARCAMPFDFTDVAPKAGVNYYRLKMTEIDGKISYSPVIAIINKSTGFAIVNMLPNVVSSSAWLNVTSATADQLQIRVADISGKMVYQSTTAMAVGSNSIQLQLSSLPAGLYQLTCYTGEGSVQTIRFVKQ